MRHDADAKKISRGVLFAIEGIDGSGKTTQAERLAAALSGDGYAVVRLREPTDGKFGKQIREAAHANRRREDPEREYRLFLLDRQENVRENIAPALAAGRIVILDRYYFSTMAYQGARGLDPGRIRVENEAFAPIPDRVFFISITVAEGLRRISQGRDGFTFFEEEKYLGRVKEIFDEHLTCLPFVVTVDGMAGPDAVSGEIGRAAAAYLDTLAS
jgi:dTMP kinase